MAGVPSTDGQALTILNDPLSNVTSVILVRAAMPRPMSSDCEQAVGGQWSVIVQESIVHTRNHCTHQESLYTPGVIVQTGRPRVTTSPVQ